MNRGGGQQPPSRLSHFAASVGTETPTAQGRSDKSPARSRRAGQVPKSRDDLLAEAASSSGDYIFLVGKKNSMPHGPVKSGKKRVARQFFSVCDEQTTHII